MGIFFLQSPLYLAKPSTQLDLKMHLKTLFWFFEQLANTRTLHSKIEVFIVVLPENRAFKNHTHFPYHKSKNLLQSPHKVPVFPHISPGFPPLGKPMTSALVPYG